MFLQIRPRDALTHRMDTSSFWPPQHGGFWGSRFGLIIQYEEFRARSYWLIQHGGLRGGRFGRSMMGIPKVSRFGLSNMRDS